ncbi:KilA-N domain-containing protein [Thiocystis violascens DSM 198]|uniref:KilA-N domain-containing protein n=2 Tax=Thiocystis violascens TaxID=73141 RepID=I3YGX0_THIV6|nr:KilA-N domain-containing protein [Thiocystis violascens DSM 198]
MYAMQHPLSATLYLDGIAIRQVDRGLFCINDLHRAAGGKKRDQPSNWLCLEQTKALIDECAKTVAGGSDGKPGTEYDQPVRVIQGGDPAAQGTYVIRELVYAYAMWISPAFHLRAIRFLDAALRGDTAPQADADCARLLRLTREALLEIAPQLEMVFRCANAGLTNAQTARAVGTSQRRIERLKARLRRLGLLPEVCATPSSQLDLFAEAI